MQEKIDIGDPVLVVRNLDFFLGGKTGVVRNFYNNNSVGIEFTDIEHPDLHDCHGSVASGKGYYVPVKALIKMYTVNSVVKNLLSKACNVINNRSN